MLARATAASWEDSSWGLIVGSMPLIGLVFFIGLYVYAKRQGRHVLQRNAALGCLVCLLIVFVFMLLPAR